MEFEVEETMLEGEEELGDAEVVINEVLILGLGGGKDSHDG